MSSYPLDIGSNQYRERDPAFSTELGDFIADSRINVWMYGHSHTNIDTVIGTTKIVSNQMGYTFYDEHLYNGFEAGKYIEI